MPKTSYPDTSINDDWNSRQPQPVSSFADDVEKASNTPEAKVHSFDEQRDLVETSVGAVPSDSATADAARDVTVKDPETVGIFALGGPSGSEPGDSGSTVPDATLSVDRTEVAETQDGDQQPPAPEATASEDEAPVVSDEEAAPRARRSRTN